MLLANPAPLDPKYLVIRVADWIFHHESEDHHTSVRLNGDPTNWTITPINGDDYQVYKQWFFYNTPADPMFGGQPTIYLPTGARQMAPA